MDGQRELLYVVYNIFLIDYIDYIVMLPPSATCSFFKGSDMQFVSWQLHPRVANIVGMHRSSTHSTWRPWDVRCPHPPIPSEHILLRPKSICTSAIVSFTRYASCAFLCVIFTKLLSSIMSSWQRAWILLLVVFLFFSDLLVLQILRASLSIPIIPDYAGSLWTLSHKIIHTRF